MNIYITMIEVQERECSYLTAELHDNINQILTTTRLYLDTAIKDEQVRLNLIVDSKNFINSNGRNKDFMFLLSPLLAQTILISALNDLIEH